MDPKLAQELIAALKELRQKDAAEIVKLKIRLAKYEPDSLKGKTEKGKIIQFYPARIQQHTS